MRKTATFSISEESIKWLNSTKNKSKAIDELIMKEVHNEINPDKVVEEIGRIDQDVRELIHKKTIILNKIAPILEDKKLQKNAEIEKIDEIKRLDKQKTDNFIRKVGRIEDINKILEGAQNNENFDYKNALGECWGCKGWFGELNESHLREFVRRKSK